MNEDKKVKKEKYVCNQVKLKMQEWIMRRLR